MRAHVIDGGVVINSVLVDALDGLPGVVLIDADLHGGGIGWRWDGVTLTPPPDQPQVVPASVTMRQARLALLAAGLLDDVDAAIAAIPDPVQRKAAQIEWEYATEVRRESPMLAMLAPALGLDDAALDDLFRRAAEVPA